jgi:DNA-binding FadR family transcriptional regulator
MRGTIDRMRLHADNFGKRDAADREFHVRIAAATGNGSLALVVEGLWQQRRGQLWARIETYFHTQKMREGVLLDHTAIIEALAHRDPETARAAMHKHLARVEREFQRQWDVIVPGDETTNGVRRTAVARKRNATTQSAT